MMLTLATYEWQNFYNVQLWKDHRTTNFYHESSVSVFRCTSLKALQLYPEDDNKIITKYN